MSRIVVVGAGQAGQALVTKLRGLGHSDELTLIGEESQPPYQRPPLSKAYLLGEMELERLYLRPESYYHENGIALRLGQAVESIDRHKQAVMVGGQPVPYDQLVLTTGAVPRRLPSAIGGELGGVHVIRTLHDVDQMAPEFREGRHVLIIGGGYIGLEAAAVAAKKGLMVTLVEMADRILQRVASPETSDFFRRLHMDHGVDLREGVGLKRLVGDDRVERAELTDGTVLDVDFVVVGVGITPATALAEDAKLEIDNGISTDARGRTTDPSIFAAGDCASFPCRGLRMRLESVGNAIDHAELIAQNIMGAEKDYDPRPWFWSDQYETKLQIAGLGTGYNRVVVRPGEHEWSVSHWYYQDDRLLAVDAMNDARAYMVGKRMIDVGRSPDPAAIADPATDLKAMLKG